MMPDKARRKFKFPPISEVIMGISFVPVLLFKSQHVGLYWGKVKDRFAHCEQKEPYFHAIPATGIVQFLQDAPGEVFPMPRYWLFDREDGTLIQIQRDMFMINWRKGNNGIYPHYEQVAKEFWNELDVFKEFLNENFASGVDAVKQCELTYSNVIEESDSIKFPQSIPDIVPALKGMFEVATEEHPVAAMNSIVGYRINNNTRMDVSVRLGRRADTGKIVMGFELKVMGAPAELSLEATRDWYDTAHDAIYESFLRMTGERMQRDVWKLK